MVWAEEVLFGDQNVVFFGYIFVQMHNNSASIVNALLANVVHMASTSLLGHGGLSVGAPRLHRLLNMIP